MSVDLGTPTEGWPGAAWCLPHRTSAALWLFLPDVARVVGQGTPSAEMKPCPVPEASGWLRSTTSGLCEACLQPSLWPQACGKQARKLFLLASRSRTMAPASLLHWHDASVAWPTSLAQVPTFREALLCSESVPHFQELLLLEAEAEYLLSCDLQLPLQMSHGYGLWRLSPFLGETRELRLVLCDHGSPVSQALYTKPNQETALRRAYWTSHRLGDGEVAHCMAHRAAHLPSRNHHGWGLAGDTLQRKDSRVPCFELGVGNSTQVSVSYFSPRGRVA